MSSNDIPENHGNAVQSPVTFPEIGGVYLAPAPEIEDEFYEELLKEIQAGRPEKADIGEC